VPNALILFNPAVLLPTLAEIKATGKAELVNRFAADPQLISPGHHVKPGQPPAIIFHGTNDKTVPFKSVEKFRDSYVRASNQCELVAYIGE
jgi:acetyl esterase